jgi:hypothetical protein
LNRAGDRKDPNISWRTELSRRPSGEPRVELFLKDFAPVPQYLVEVHEHRVRDLNFAPICDLLGFVNNGDWKPYISKNNSLT